MSTYLELFLYQAAPDIWSSEDVYDILLSLSRCPEIFNEHEHEHGHRESIVYAYLLSRKSKSNINIEFISGNRGQKNENEILWQSLQKESKR